MGLPQRIATPPASDVLVYHRNEVDWLTRSFALLDEERDISRMQQHGGGIGETTQQCGDRPVGIFQEYLALGAVEQCLDRTAVLRVQPRLGTLQHRGKTSPPGHIQPWRVIPFGVGGTAAVTDRQFDVTLQPLQVGHLGDIAEIGFGGRGHGCDDLIAARGNRVAVTGDVIEQPTAP